VTRTIVLRHSRIIHNSMPTRPLLRASFRDSKLYKVQPINKTNALSNPKTAHVIICLSSSAARRPRCSSTTVTCPPQCNTTPQLAKQVGSNTSSCTDMNSSLHQCHLRLCSIRLPLYRLPIGACIINKPDCQTT